MQRSNKACFCVITFVTFHVDWPNKMRSCDFYKYFKYWALCFYNIWEAWRSRPGLGPKFPPGSIIEQGGGASARGRHKAHVKFLGAHRARARSVLWPVRACGEVPNLLFNRQCTVTNHVKLRDFCTLDGLKVFQSLQKN